MTSNGNSSKAFHVNKFIGPSFLILTFLVFLLLFIFYSMSILILAVIIGFIMGIHITIGPSYQKTHTFFKGIANDATLLVSIKGIIFFLVIIVISIFSLAIGAHPFLIFILGLFGFWGYSVAMIQQMAIILYGKSKQYSEKATSLTFQPTREDENEVFSHQNPFLSDLKLFRNLSLIILLSVTAVVLLDSMNILDKHPFGTTIFSYFAVGSTLLLLLFFQFLVFGTQSESEYLKDGNKIDNQNIKR